MICGQITSRSNPLVRHYRKLSSDKRYRYECREFLCDGIKLLYEAIASGAEIDSVLLGEKLSERILKECPELSNFRITLAPDHIIEAASELEAPQGVLFACRMPELKPVEGERIILLDRLQDTGNIGTIIRCADAFAIDAVVLDGCADPYNPKTVRSAMGSLFRVPIVFSELGGAIPELQARGIRVYASCLNPDSAEIDKIRLNPGAVVIGNEGAGVRGEISAICDGSVIIPMRGGAESLNAAIAAAIFMREMSR